MKYTKHSFEYNYKPNTHILCDIIYILYSNTNYYKKKVLFYIYFFF